MAFNETIAQRVRDSLSGMKAISERKMFGGLCFMIDGKMICGVSKDQLLVRVSPMQIDELMKNKGVHPFVIGKMTTKGFLLVDESLLKTKQELENWLNLSLDYVVPLFVKKIFILKGY